MFFIAKNKEKKKIQSGILYIVSLTKAALNLNEDSFVTARGILYPDAS